MLFSFLVDGNLCSHIKERAVIHDASGSGGKGKVRAYNGKAVAGWRNVLNENAANSIPPDNKLPNKINLIKTKRTIYYF